MPTKLKALIFDFDGLVVDTETSIYEAWREVYAQHGQVLELATYAKCVGSDHGQFDPMQHLDGLLGKSLDWATLEPVKQDRIMELLADQPTLPGVRELLTAAAKRDLPCAVASSSSLSWVGNWLEKLDIAHHFQIVRTRDDVQRIKPYPDLFLAAAEGLGIDPSEAIVLEDSENGLKASIAAGIRCVAVPNQITAHGNFDSAALRLDSMEQANLSTFEALFDNQ